MQDLDPAILTLVHCHVGSLEKIELVVYIGQTVHCHVGSLEMLCNTGGTANLVHCHVGSLENFGQP